MSKVTHDFTHLWNDLPFEERSRMMPYMVESQKLHIIQTKQKAIDAHNRQMREIDEWIKNLDRELDKYRR